MRLFDLSPTELAKIVEEAFLADQGEFTGSAAWDFDTLQQLRGFLRGKPELAGAVLQAWQTTITGEDAADDQAEAEEWFDRVLLGTRRAN